MHRGSVDAIRGGFNGKGSDELLTAPTSPVRQNIIIHQSDLANNSGSDATMGYGYKVLAADFSVGQWDASAGTEFIDDTVDAQDAGASDVALATASVNNDGFVVSSSRKFDAVNIVVGTAEAGSPVYAYAYWNGTAWTALVPVVAPDFTATGETALVFSAPSDWALGGDTGEGIDATHYAVRVIATTAPSTAPLATTLHPVVLLDLVGKVSDGSTVNKIQYVMSTGNKIPSGHALVPYSSVADNSNVFYFEYTHI